MINLNTAIKLRNFFLIVGFFTLFIGGQNVFNSEGGINTFFESLSMAGALFGAQYYLFSEGFYDALKEDGFPISVRLYQLIGLITAMISCTIVSLAMYT